MPRIEDIIVRASICADWQANDAIRRRRRNMQSIPYGGIHQRLHVDEIRAYRMQALLARPDSGGIGDRMGATGFTVYWGDHPIPQVMENSSGRVIIPAADVEFIRPGLRKRLYRLGRARGDGLEAFMLWTDEAEQISSPPNM